MFRRWLSSFWKRNKGKITTYLKTCMVMIFGAYMVFIVINLFAETQKTSENKVDETKLVYKPTKTIASGKNISSEEYEEENNLVEVFIDNCNNQNVEEAYEMLTNDCKEDLFPDVETFKENYYNNIFTEKRVYNMQSWIVKENYHTYIVRFVNDALNTGIYKKDNVYQDYITIVNENDSKKISICNFIKNEKVNKTLDENQISISVTNKKEYMDYLVFVINVKNNSSKTIKLDAYERLDGIKLKMNNGSNYPIDWNGFIMDNLIIKPGNNQKLQIRFNVPYGLNSIPKKIEFTNIVLDYNVYNELEEYQDRIDYENKAKMEISL